MNLFDAGLKHLFIFVLLLILAGNISTSAAQQEIFSDGFESGILDPAYWTARPSIAGNSGGRVEVVNSSSNARSGTSSVFIGRSTDGQSTTNALDLRLDLSGQTEVELNFWLREYYEEDQSEEGIYFSDDGGQQFTQVFTFNFDEETDLVYLNPPPIDVDALAQAHGLSLTSTFVIRFQQIGTGDFSTTGDEDGFMIDDLSVTVPSIIYTALPFEDGFESGVLAGMWHEANATEVATGQPTAPSFAPARRGGRVEVVNSSSNARSGTSSVFIGRSTDGQSTTNALDLRLDLSGQTEVELNFWLREYYEEDQSEEGIYFSDDGGQQFTQVFTFNFDEETDLVYLNPPPIDVDALAQAHGLSLTSTFVIRFQQIGTGDFSTTGDEDGFMIDDLSVTVPSIIYTALPFEDGFESGVLAGMWHEANATEVATGQPTAPSFAPARRGGRVEVVNSSSNARSGTSSVFIGRSTDGQSTTNALDLRLDLSGQTEVELNFWLREYYEEDQSEEGIYFSDDGGQQFTQVFTFNFDEETDLVYLNPPPIDVDALARAHGLSLTSTFVIRFQQIGTGDFSTTGDEDGFMIDDLSVTVPSINYAGLTTTVSGGYAFEEDFESGVFESMWTVTNPSDSSIGQPTAPGFAPAQRGGRVQVVNSSNNARNGSFSAFIGRDVDGPSTTNALDLHLNLVGQNQVELRFWMRDYYDETQQEEGIYLSDNGGENFAFAIPLDPSSQTDLQYTEYVIDLSDLVAQNDLTFSSKFIIRFQQIGAGDFRTTGDEDGFMIDDISVTGDLKTTTVSNENEVSAFELSLLQNYPNPFNPSTTIGFELDTAGHTRLAVYNMLGQELVVLVDDFLQPGTYKIDFSAKKLRSGIYVYGLDTRGHRITKTMILMK